MKASQDIPLSRIVTLAQAHGGRYSANGVGKWPWGSRHVPEERRADNCNCSTFSLAVLARAFERSPDLFEHALWMIDGKTARRAHALPEVGDDLSALLAEGPLVAARRMLMTTTRDTGVTLRQGWKGDPLKSRGHTWVQVETSEGPMVIDATPSGPWYGPRVLEPRPKGWSDWITEFQVSLSVDRAA